MKSYNYSNLLRTDFWLFFCQIKVVQISLNTWRNRATLLNQKSFKKSCLRIQIQAVPNAKKLFMSIAKRKMMRNSSFWSKLIVRNAGDLCFIIQTGQDLMNHWDLRSTHLFNHSDCQSHNVDIFITLSVSLNPDLIITARAVSFGFKGGPIIIFLFF